MVNGKRLLFFDLLRTIAVALIVFHHVACKIPGMICPNYGVIFNVFYLGAGYDGLYLLIFVSGAVLEYTYPRLKGIEEISVFYVKRLFRLYPALWMSLILGLVISPWLISRPLFSTFLEFVSVNVWTGTGGGLINPAGWFIGLIFVLYLMFPFISPAIRKYPYLTLGLIAFVEIFLRYGFHLGLIPMFHGTADRWVPICNLLEFSLGIFIVQQDFFPKWTYDSHAISFLAEISFYVYLVHYIPGMTAILVYSLPLYIVAVALFTWLLMLGDQRVQGWLKKVARF